MPSAQRAQQRPLWTCPKCGRRYITRNMWHSCARLPLSAHFRGKPAVLRQVFNRLRAMLRARGPVTIYSRPSAIVFQVRVRFGGARVRKGWLEAGLWLEHRARHPRLVRTTSFRTIGSHGYAHYFHFTTPSQLDRPFARLVAEAYDVGAQRSHPRRAPGRPLRPAGPKGLSVRRHS